MTRKKSIAKQVVSDTPVTDGFEKVKIWWTSQTIWGVILAAIGLFLSAVFPDLGLDIDGAVQVIMEDGQQIAEKADVTYGGVLAIWGLVQAFLGRIKAKVGIKKSIV